MADEDLTSVVEDEVVDADEDAGQEEDFVDEGVDDDDEVVDDEEGGDDEGSSLDAELVSRAEDYGLTTEDLEGLSAERVEALFSKIDQRIISEGNAPPVPKTEDKKSEAPASMPSDFEPMKVEMDDLDEDFVKPIQSMVEQHNKQMKELHEFRDAVVNEFQSFQTLREVDEFDKFIGSLGEDWVAEYGTGSMLEMDPKSKAYKNRADVFFGGKTLGQDAMRRGDRMSLSSAWKRSHNGANYEKLDKKARESLQRKVSKRKRQTTERPNKGGKSAGKSDPIAEAIAIMGGKKP